MVTYWAFNKVWNKVKTEMSDEHITKLFLDPSHIQKQMESLEKRLGRLNKGFQE